VVLLVAAAAGARAMFHRPAAGPAAPVRRAIPGERETLQVEVLNASRAVGLARAVTRRLRDAGLDVVYYGSDAETALDSTEILVRRGDAAAGARVREALGAGRVLAAPDASRLVDVTVRLGADLAAVRRDP
jgi:hypothetical protein